MKAVELEGTEQQRPVVPGVSFSQNVKAELLSLSVKPEELRAILAVALMSTAKFKAAEIRYALSYRPFVQLMGEALTRYFELDVRLIEGKGLYVLEVPGREPCARVRAWLLEDYCFDSARGLLQLSPQGLAEGLRRALLRGLFLSCGSFAEPQKAYHLEFSVHRSSLADFTAALLAGFGIRSGLLSRYGYNVVYVKDGQLIAELLGLMGASTNLLRFEAGRVDKEMNNAVNRMVNCDSANARRIADTSARQMKLLERLRAEKAYSALPEHLRELAESRLQNPGLSLADLGRLQNPPLSKSGMYHRLKSLEKWAEKLLCP